MEKFTSKERDAETGIDFFGARYMSSAQGRFSSVDPALESEYLETPQSWNRYSYVYNQPLTLTDPDGRCPQCLPALGVGLIGGAVSAAATAYYELKTTGDFNGRDVGAAFAGGFVSSGLAVLTLGTSLVAEAELGTVLAVGAGSNIVGGVVERSLDSTPGNTFDPGSMALDAATGGGGALIGNYVGLLYARDFAPVRPSIRKFGTKAFSASRRVYKGRVANLNTTAGRASIGISIGISNAIGRLAPLAPSPFDTSLLGSGITFVTSKVCFPNLNGGQTCQ